MAYRRDERGPRTDGRARARPVHAANAGRRAVKQLILPFGAFLMLGLLGGAGGVMLRLRLAPPVVATAHAAGSSTAAQDSTAAKDSTHRDTTAAKHTVASPTGAHAPDTSKQAAKPA